MAKRYSYQVFGRRLDGIEEFIHTAYVYSEFQACSCVKKCHTDLLYDEDGYLLYAVLWAKYDGPPNKALPNDSGEAIAF